jgi:hypothetical protein
MMTVSNDRNGSKVATRAMAGMGGKLPLPLYASSMTAGPKFKLSRLRDIGWSEWDPIGLKGIEGAEDEYDAYLLQAAGRLWNGESEEDVASYLAGIEADHMGLGHGFGIKSRARATVKAIQEYSNSLR